MTLHPFSAFKRLFFIFWAGFFILSSCRHSMPDPPVAQKIQYTDTINGKPFPDPYHWLENQNDTLVLKYVSEETNYAEAYFDNLQDLRKKIRTELDQRGGYFDNNKTRVSDLDTCWGPGKKYLVVTENNTTVRVHQPGQNPSDDRIIYTESRPGFEIQAFFSASKNFLFIRSFSDEMSETRFLPADFRGQEPILVQPGEKGHFYDVDHFGSDIFWIRTNDKAPNGKLVQAKVLNPEKKFWIPAVIYPDSTLLNDFEIINMQYLILSEIKSTRASVRITDLTAIHDPNKGNRIGFKDPDGEVILCGYEQQSGKALFRFSSVVAPTTMYAYDLKKDKLAVRWQTKVPGYNRDNYGTRILPLTTKTGDNMLLTLFFHKDFELRDGSSPLLLTTEDGLTGYGDSRFNPAWLSLLDRGFYIAIVHPGGDPAPGHGVRREQGLLEGANFLISEKYTSNGQITLTGKNQGAMAALYAMNSTPTLFKAVVLEHPFVDPDIPVKEIHPGAPILIVSAGPENPKTNMGPLKTMAMLRNNNTDNNPLLLSSKAPFASDGKIRPDKPDLTDQITFILSCYELE